MNGLILIGKLGHMCVCPCTRESVEHIIATSNYSRVIDLVSNMHADFAITEIHEIYMNFIVHFIDQAANS